MIWKKEEVLDGMFITSSFFLILWLKRLNYGKGEFLWMLKNCYMKKAKGKKKLVNFFSYILYT